MTATQERQRTTGRLRLSSPPSRKRPHSWAALRWVAAILLLTGGLVFCHGCHGDDEDNELSVPAWKDRRPRDQDRYEPGTRGTSIGRAGTKS